MNINKLKVSKVQFEALKKIQPQSSMSVTPVENTGATAEDAPYLPRVIPAGTKTLDDIIDEVALITGESFEQSRFYWNAMIELVTKILTDGVHTEVNFGFWSFALAIEGSVQSADAQPSTTANPVYFACYPSEELNRVAEGIETKRNIAAQAFIVEEVFGVDTAKSRLVTAGEDMHVFGRKLSMGATGEKAELVKGENVYPLTYKDDTEDLPTRMDFAIPANVPAGKGYVLRVTAWGKDGQMAHPEMEIVEKENITVLAAPTPPAPTMTKVTTEGLEDDQTAYDHQSVLHGTNLKMETGDKLYITLLTADGETDEEEFTGVTAVTSTETTITSPETGFWPNASEHPDSEWVDPESTVTLKLVKANGATVSHRIYPKEVAP